MPRYFFDIHDGDDYNDELGMVLWGNEAARREAFDRAAKYASNPINLMMDGVLVMRVRDSLAALFELRLVCQMAELDQDKEGSKGSAMLEADTL